MGARNPLLISGKSGAYSGTYNAEYRTPKQLQFLYQKIAYANATGGGSSVGTPQGTGIEANTGFYQSEPASKNGIQDGARFIPKAHITSVRISNEGDMGTIERAEVAFTVYSLGQLNSAKGFFGPGNDLKVSWGWSGGFGGGSFSGKIVNFSYSLNGDGGFDCTSTGIGPGMAIPSVNPNAAIASAGEFVDELDKKYIGGSLATNLFIKASNVVGTDGQTSKFDAGAGVGGFAIDEAWTTLPPDPENKPPEGQKKMYLYCTLKAVVDQVNEILTKAGGIGQIIIKPWKKKPFVDPHTANPLSVLISPAAYGAIDFAGAPETSTDPGTVVVSINFLKELCGKVGKDNKPSGKSRDITISNFFDQLFTEIAECTGHACKLTLIGDDTPGSNNVLIVDAEDTDTVTKGMISAVTQGGEARSMTIVSKLPSEVTAMSYIATNSDAVVTGKASFSQMGGPKKTAAPPNSWAEALQALSDAGAFPETIAAAKSQLSNKVKAELGGGTVPIPIDFGATVDGQGGWRWGMSVTSNYLPASHQRATVHFVVTKVEHNISGGDYTTTLSTIMRLTRQ